MKWKKNSIGKYQKKKEKKHSLLKTIFPLAHINETNNKLKRFEYFTMVFYATNFILLPSKYMNFPFQLITVFFFSMNQNTLSTQSIWIIYIFGNRKQFGRINEEKNLTNSLPKLKFELKWKHSDLYNPFIGISKWLMHFFVLVFSPNRWKKENIEFDVFDFGLGEKNKPFQSHCEQLSLITVFILNRKEWKYLFPCLFSRIWGFCGYVFFVGFVQYLEFQSILNSPPFTPLAVVLIGLVNFIFFCWCYCNKKKNSKQIIWFVSAKIWSAFLAIYKSNALA